MFASIQARAPGAADALLVPADAVLHSGEHAVVVVAPRRRLLHPAASPPGPGERRPATGRRRTERRRGDRGFLAVPESTPRATSRRRSPSCWAGRTPAPKARSLRRSQRARTPEAAAAFPPRQAPPGGIQACWCASSTGRSTTGRSCCWARWCSPAWGAFSLLRTPLDAISRPVGRAGGPVHRVPWPGAAHRRGPGHLPADDADAVGALFDRRARLLVLRLFARPRAVSRTAPTRYWARSRVLESLSHAASRLPPGVTPTLGPDATGRGLGVHLRVDLRPSRSERAAIDSGLVPQVRAERGSRRRRSRQRRRLRAPVPDHRRSRSSAGVRHLRRADPGRRQAEQRRGGRPPPGGGPAGVHGSGARLHRVA